MRPPKAELPARAFAELKLPALPNNAVLATQSAAAIYRLPLVRNHRRALMLPVGFHARGCDGWEVQRTRLGPDDLTLTSDGVAVTTARRTVIDCCLRLPFYDGVAVLDSALNRELIELGDIQTVATLARGRHSGALKKAVTWCDGRAESAQESVGRVALQQAGMPCEPQYALFDGDYQHRFDLCLTWAKLLIDLQSKAHHSQWPAVERDIGYLETVNLTRGWRLALTVPRQVLPDPFRFVRHVMGVAVNQPGPRSRALRHRYVVEGTVVWPQRASDVTLYSGLMERNRSQTG